MTTLTIRLNATLHPSKARAIFWLPEAASKKLPSRGQVPCKGDTFRTGMEPDGNRGHWMNVDERLQRGSRQSRAPSGSAR